MLADAYMEKNLNKEEYNENEYLDKYVQGKNPEIYIEGDEIGLNGYIFELDRSVPKLGKYKGKETGPRIKEIKVTNKTTNSVTVEVDARNVEDANYTYSYQKVGESEWKDAGTSKDNTCTIGNLESNESYTIKVKVETKNGVAEKEISTTIGELPEGTITFGEVEWAGDGTASVAINTSEEGYQLQYQKNGIDGQWTTIGNGEKITGLVHNDTVYGRLFDGTNGTKDEASISIKDEVNPVVTVSPSTKTTNSIQVTVSAVDNESGMADSLTYTYYIKKTSEPETSYVAKANGIAQNSYKFTGLTQETSYDVKVEVVGDKAGRKGTGTLQNQVTTKVGGADGGLVTGNIVASTPTWSNGEASITLTTNTGLQIQYQVNGIDEENWTTVSTGGQVSGLHHNDTVYARLYDGTNFGDYGSVSIQDGIDPVVTVSPGGTTTNSITVSASAVDNESGMADSLTYTYYIKKTSEPDTSYVAKASNVPQNSCTFTGLTQETSYDVKIEVTGDKAGRKGTGTLANQITTKVGGAEGDLTTGNIVASTPTWASGTASITLTTNTGMQIQYQVNGIDEGSWTTATTGVQVTGLHHNDTIYARLYDGVNTGDYGSVSIQDGIDPVVTVSPGTKTTNSITVSVSAVDNESGMADSLTYTYYIKKTGEAETSYVAKASNVAQNNYTFTGLTQETSYDVKVEVTGDKAGRTGTGTLPNQVTTKVGGADGGLVTGNIVASTPTWSSGEASITLTTNTGLKIQYQKNSISGSWTTISSGGKVTGLKHNDTVYARLWDGNNAGDYGSVSIIDNIAPTVSISTSNLTYNSVKLTVTASDEQSGLATSGTYKYYLGSTLKTTSRSSSYTFTGLTANTSYTLKVIVTDKAGKTTEKSTTIKTAVPPEYVDSVLPSVPELAAGMTPVKWNGSNWIKTTKTDSEWYDYANKEWANVVLGDATFSGNILDESKPYSMLVWIPRYAYKITSGWHSSTTGTIDVIFIDENNKSKSGTTYNGTYDGETGIYSNYVVHPAFNYGNSNENKLRGLWVGKYETSNTDCTTSSSSGEYNGTDKTIQIKAGVTSWREITVSNIYTVCTQMNKSGNPYGLSTSDSVVDPHMMKNTEWGAVAYLSKSKYGKETEEVWINPNSKYITGEAGSSVSASSTTSTNNYKSTNGQKASTTGNTTGVYDMSGGAWEYVASYLNNGDRGLQDNGKNLVNAEARYKYVYRVGKDDIYTDKYNYEEARSKYGDAVYEISSGSGIGLAWYLDESVMPRGGNPFFGRGNDCESNNSAGVFSFDSFTGYAGNNSFRVVVPVL